MGLAQLFTDKQEQLRSAWLNNLLKSGDQLAKIGQETLAAQVAELLGLIATAASSGDLKVDAPAWLPVRNFLDTLSESRAADRYTSVQTAQFIFSMRPPLFDLVRKQWGKDPEALATETLAASDVVEQLGLRTIAAYQKSRENVILRQQEDMLELSTPVVKLWDGILALPMIGTLDSARTQVVMESLLQRIVETGAQIAILDITGVPTVDTLVAQHLLKTVTAIRLMGSDCIISGVRPQIAQTIVHLGVDLAGITTKASLADALALALKQTGQAVVRTAPVAST